MTGIIGRALVALCFCNPFRLKMHWQPGYRWQKQHLPRRWCMTHSYHGYFGLCWNGPNRPLCRPDQIYISFCDFDNRQQFTFVELRNDEFQIKVPLKNQCFQRVGGLIKLRRCDSSNNAQRFYKRNGGNGRFSIGQKGTNRCITQKHHPKNAEVVRMDSCSTAAEHNTLYWEKA